MALNLIFSIFGGFSIYVAFSALTNSLIFRQRRAILEDDTAPSQGPTFMERLQTLLYQARAPIGVGEFLMISGLIGALISIGFFFATGALGVAILLYPLGSILYYLYLTSRRDTAMMEYEKAQPQVAYVLVGAFRSGGLNVDNAIEQVLTNSPEIVHEDWERIRAAIASAEPDYLTVNQVLVDRNSPGLWKLVEALLQFKDEVERIPPAIEGLRERIVQEVVLARENASLLKSGQRQLMLMSAMPVAMLLFFTIAAPEFRSFYSSFIGQIVMLFVFALCLGIYLVGARFAARASLVRPYTVDFAQERGAKSYQLPKRQSAPSASQEQQAPTIGSSLMAEPEDLVEIEEDPGPKVPGEQHTPRSLSDLVDNEEGN